WAHTMGIGGWRDPAGLAVSIAAGVAAFAGAAFALRVQGLAEAAALVRKKLKRG
ncbi:MAG: hypothetical protein H7067_13145, partial [Burkholderiales bacterium]|nr:hypothetical protein [Opitutaceae bacterium]